MRRHVVEEGDCMSSIAVRYGFTPDTLWSLPENAELRERRASMFQLVPGQDVVMIPELRQRVERVRTGQRHVFRRLAVPERLRLRFRDADGRPRAGLPYTLQVDGALTLEGMTGSGGELEQFIPNDAAVGELTLHAQPPEEYRLALARLLPVTSPAGVQQRLKSLGCYFGEIDGADSAATRAALEQFQRDEQLDVTGQADAATRERLDTLFGP